MKLANSFHEKCKKNINFLARFSVMLSFCAFFVVSAEAGCLYCAPNERQEGWEDPPNESTPICVPADCPATNNSDESETCTIDGQTVDWSGSHPHWFNGSGGTVSLNLGAFNDIGARSTSFPIYCQGIYYSGGSVTSSIHDHEEDVVVTKYRTSPRRVCVEYDYYQNV